MTDVLTHAALIAAVSLGAWTAMGEGMVLAFIPRLLAWARVPAWVRAPLCDCPRCTVSVWGAATLFALGAWPSGPLMGLPEFIVTIIAATGIQEMIHRP